MTWLRIGALLGASLLLTAPSIPDVGEVNIYNWSSYLPDDVKADFTKETGIRLNYEEYDSNETMLAKVFAGGDYDVVFPSQNFVPIMIQRGLLAEIDASQIPNLSTIDQNILDNSQLFDPGHRYTVPYNLGATAIVYWKDKIPNPVQSFGLFGDQRYRGKLVLLDDNREVFGAALHNLGFSGNTTDPGQIAQAAKLVLKWKANGVRFDTDQAPSLFMRKEAWAALIYPENILTTLDETQRSQVGFFFPQEGGMKYQDSMVILQNAKNIENAHKFINYLLRPDIQARIDDVYGYPGISAKANALRKNPPYYPSSSLDKYEFTADVGEAMDLYNRPWVEEISNGQ